MVESNAPSIPLMILPLASLAFARRTRATDLLSRLRSATERHDWMAFSMTVFVRIELWTEMSVNYVWRMKDGPR